MWIIEKGKYEILINKNANENILKSSIEISQNYDIEKTLNICLPKEKVKIILPSKE